MTIDNTKVFKCACLAHVYSTDTSGKYVLITDPGRAHLLRNVTWHVSRMHSKSKLLRARASTSAPGIKLGSQLHQLVMRMRSKRRRVWAISRNYLDCRRETLRFVSHADARILSSSRPSTQAVGVSRPAQPSFFKTLHRPFLSRIRVEGKDLCLGWFATLEEGQCAYDAAAIMVHGATATTNQSLGLLSPEVAKTKSCRRAAKAARKVVKERWSGKLVKKYQALTRAKSQKRQLQLFAGIRAVGKPMREPRIEVYA